jgi:hypothetical protein
MALGNNKSQDNNQPNSTESQGTLSEVKVTATRDTDEKPNKRPYNPLSKFSSYTYSISLYALTPDSYNNWNTNGKWLTKDLELLVQSGGVNNSPNNKRNKHFDLDFGIDDLEITSLINGKESRNSGNQSNFKFKIYEPFGLSFPSRLVRAQTEIQQQANIKRPIKQQVQALACPLLVVIRFHGYDENGKLVKNMSDPDKNGYTKTDTNANFERAFPIIINKFSFKLDGKVTVYDVEALMVNENVGFGVKRGIIKTGFELAGDTVSSVVTQLLDKVNQQQKDLTAAPKDPNKPPDQTVADVYKIIFEDKSGIGDSLIVDKDFYVKNYAQATPKVTNINEINDRLANSGSANTVNKGNRIVNIAAGTTVLTAIDQIITQSAFIKTSLDELDKEEIQKRQVQDSTTTKTSKPIELYWYHVRPSAKIIGYDESRNDYAYEIVYNVVKYRIPNVQSLYLGKTIKYHGPHKIYDYYFSGDNTEILDYNCTYNLAYYNLGSLASNAANAKNPNNSISNSQEPAQNADPTGALPGARELINSVKSYLYSPTDALNATLSILGDPDYLMPSEAGSAETMFKLWYGQDFTINTNSGQVYIEIGFKQVEDYNNDTGTLEPKNNIVFWTYPQGSDIEKQTEGRMVYMLKTVVSKFSNGVFKQELKSIIPSFANQPGETGLRADENQSQAEVNRLLRQNASRPNIVSNSTSPSPSTVSSTASSMKNYVPRDFSPKDDNAPPDTALAKGVQQILNSSSARARENAERLNITKLPGFR